MGSISKFFAIVFLIVPNLAGAQLCQGSLGDPIVNISFGSGPNPGPRLSAATTNYQFDFNDCPNDGLYTVRNNTTDCFGFSWHSLTNDHTGNNGGYFMLVNASLQPSAFYIDTVKGLCSNTTFEFAAWIVNVLKSTACGSSGNQPNLTFTIETTNGAVIQSYNTGNIPQSSSADWKQYGFYFSTPPGVSDVVLRIFNNALGGCGNDLALDDITFRPCGPQIIPVIDGFNSLNVSYCTGTSQSFTFRAAISTGFSIPQFQWQVSTDNSNWTDIAGATATTYTANFTSATTPSTYYYRLAAAEQGNFNSVKCRVVSQVITVGVGSVPVTSINVSSPVCQGGIATLTATGGTDYSWTKEGGGLVVFDNKATISNIDFSDSGKIYVLVKSNGGCSHLDSAYLKVLPKPTATVSFDSTGICTGKSIQLSGGGNGTYHWMPAATLSSDAIPNPVASPAATTVYSLVVTNANGCTDTAFIKVTVVESPHVNAGPDQTIIAGNSVKLLASVTGQEVSFSWSPPDDLSSAVVLQPIATPPADIHYTLTATSNAGCGTDVDKVHVFVFNDLFIPNAFSPDANGNNDTWNIPALNAFPNFELRVYNRAGVLVYQCAQLLKPWDGTYKGEPQPPGAYVYVIDVHDRKRPLYKGSVLLIR